LKKRLSKSGQAALGRRRCADFAWIDLGLALTRNP
jgi:hypothetical protein